MGQVLLVRHGQASWGAEDYDLLSPLGWEQARLLGAAFALRGLKPEVIVQGGMRRHRETTRAVCEAAGWDGLEVMNDPAWNEFDHLGMLAAHPGPEWADGEPTPEEFQEWFEAASLRWTSGKGDYPESFETFTQRVTDAFARTSALVGPSATGVVLTSGGAITWIVAHLLTGGAASDPATAALWGQLNKVVVNSSVTKVVVGRRGATLVSFNEHSHLEGNGLSYR